MRVIGGYRNICCYVVSILIFTETACLFFIDSKYPQDGCSKAYTEEGGKNCLVWLIYDEAFRLESEQRKATPDQYEPNDTPANAHCFAQEQAFPSLTLHSAEDIDYFKFNATSIDSVYEIAGDYDSFAGLTVKLYASDGNVLAEKPVDLPDSIRHQFAQTGTYYFSIASGGDPVYYYLNFTGGPLGSCP